VPVPIPPVRFSGAINVRETCFGPTILTARDRPPCWTRAGPAPSRMAAHVLNRRIQALADESSAWSILSCVAHGWHPLRTAASRPSERQVRYAHGVTKPLAGCPAVAPNRQSARPGSSPTESSQPDIQAVDRLNASQFIVLEATAARTSLRSTSSASTSSQGTVRSIHGRSIVRVQARRRARSSLATIRKMARRLR